MENSYKKISIRDFKYIFLFYIFGFGIPYIIQFESNFFKIKTIGLMIILSIWIFTPIVILTLLSYIYYKNIRLNLNRLSKKYSPNIYYFNVVKYFLNIFIATFMK